MLRIEEILGKISVGKWLQKFTKNTTAERCGLSHICTVFNYPFKTKPKPIQ